MATGPDEHPLPPYSAEPSPSPLPPQVRFLAEEPGLQLPVTKFLPYDLETLLTKPPTRIDFAERNIVLCFFNAIHYKQLVTVTAMVVAGLVTANTVGEKGQTPLIEATFGASVKMIAKLIDLGAEVDGWGKYGGEQDQQQLRTPLMVAAEMGSLPLVKMLVNTYHANDALIAPDGQLALRLASAKECREIVDFLPARRGGGWRRWKLQHSVAVAIAKKVGRKILRFWQILFWEVPMGMGWLLKECLYRPIKRRTQFLWQHRREIGEWMKGRLKELPADVKLRMILLGKSFKRFVTETLPTICKDCAKFWWFFLTVTLPAGLKSFSLWLWKGIRIIGSSLILTAQKVISFFHTLVTAMVTFFRELTLKDVWNGFCDILHALFVDSPVQVYRWLEDFGKRTIRVFKSLAGDLGFLIRLIAYGSLYVAAYVPRKIWEILHIFGVSIAKGGHEVMVWINPKR